VRDSWTTDDDHHSQKSCRGYRVFQATLISIIVFVAVALQNSLPELSQLRTDLGAKTILAAIRVDIETLKLRASAYKTQWTLA